jgi:hypothetical protein
MVGQTDFVSLMQVFMMIGYKNEKGDILRAK